MDGHGSRLDSLNTC